MGALFVGCPFVGAFCGPFFGPFLHLTFGAFCGPFFCASPFFAIFENASQRSSLSLVLFAQGNLRDVLIDLYQCDWDSVTF